MLKPYKSRFVENTSSIDFMNINGKEIFKKGSKEYQELELLEGDAWTDYLDKMAERGITVSYDNHKDAFVVEG